MPSRRFAILAVTLAALWGAVALAQQLRSESMGTARIQFSNGAVLSGMPVAKTEAQQAKGLKGMDDVDRGMLFLWAEENSLYFWMKDTPQPLSIGFFDGNYRITAVEDMQPYSETIHRSPRPALGAIELPQGEFAAMGVEPGMTLSIDTK